MKSALLLPIVLLLIACGGGGGGGGGPAVFALVLTPQPGIDGFGSTLNTLTASGVQVGDDEFDTAFRGYYGFDTQSIPAGAVIQSATLRLYLGSVTGTPGTSYGPVAVDHKQTNATLSNLDFVFGDIVAGFATLPAVLTIGYHEVDATARLQADLLAGEPRSGYRLRPSGDGTPDNDGSTDVYVFSDVENTNGFGSPPQLVITYTLP